MSIFNPDVQNTNDPNYLGMSRPVSAYEGDTSAGVLLKGIGDTFSTAVKGADFVIKHGLEEKIYADVENERNIYTAGLEQANNQLKNPPVTGAGAPMNLLNKQNDVPGEIENLDQYIGNLKGARDANKVSPTYYYGRLRDLAKDYRAQYPGYKEYIDHKFSAITGVDPANAYASSVLGDLNATMTRQSAEKEKITSLIQQNLHIPGAEQAFEMWKAGQTTDAKVVGFIAEYKQDEARLARLKALREERAGSKAELKSDAITDAEVEAGITAQRYFNTVEKFGLPAGKTLRDIAIDKQTNPNSPYTSEQMVQAAHGIKAQKDIFISSLREKWNQPIGKTGETMMSRMGEDAEKILQRHGKVFDDIYDNITKERLDLVSLSLDTMKARTNDYQNNILRDKSVGLELEQIQLMNKLGGPEYMKAWFLNDIKAPANIKDKIDTYVKSKKMDLILNAPDVRRQGKPTTALGVITDLEQETKMDDKEKAVASNEYIKLVEQIGSKNPAINDDVKLNTIKATFSQENRGLISKFRKDSFDEQTNKPINGRWSVYQRMTSPAVTAEIMRITANDPETRKNYTDWAKETFSKELLKTELADLNKFVNEPNVQISWSTDAKGFVATSTLSPEAQRALGSATTPRFREIERSIARINSGLSSLGNIAKAEGGQDVDTYLLKELIGLGFNPGNKPSTIPEHLFNALVNSRKKADSGDAPEENNIIRASYAPADDSRFKGQPVFEKLRTLGDQGFTNNYPADKPKKTKEQLTFTGKIDKRPIEADLPNEAKALLDVIAGSESPGYNYRYGGKTFQSYEDHPREGEVIRKGPNAGKTSSAAGRYQFIQDTWDQQRNKLGLKDFSPESQDLAAWDLAETAYKRSYKGRDLATDIQNPAYHARIGRALSGEWTSLPGGIERNRATASFLNRFSSALKKYKEEDAGRVAGLDI